MVQILIIILCLGVNALIAATEFGFVAISKPRLKNLANDGSEPASKILEMRANPERSLAVMQLGITFIGVVAAAVGGAAMEHWITPWLMQTFELGAKTSSAFAILIFVVPYTYISVVISELLPKSLALKNPKWIIFHFYKWLLFWDKVLAPIVFLLEKGTKFGLKCFSSVKSEEPEKEERFAAGQLLRPYMLNLSKIEKKRIRDVIIPWDEVDKISIHAPIDKVKQIVLKTGHTRLPIVDDHMPISLLLSKEFLTFFETGDSNWSSLQKPLIKIDGEEALVRALKILQSQRSHLGIVVDGESVIGIVTIEDILEEVVGEIYDEDDILNG